MVVSNYYLHVTQAIVMKKYICTVYDSERLDATRFNYSGLKILTDIMAMSYFDSLIKSPMTSNLP